MRGEFESHAGAISSVIPQSCQHFHGGNLKRLSILLVLMSLLAVFVVNTPVAQATTYDPHPYGITLNAKDPLALTSTSATWFKPAGLSWARLQVSHKKVEPVQGQPYQWAQTDQQMSLAAQNGIMIDIPLQSFPDWDIQTGCTQVPTPAAMQDWALSLFQRYGTQIKSIEVGNEEWSFESVASCKTAANYISVLEPTVTALRNAGYTGLIGMFGFTHYSSTTDITSWFTDFIGDPSNPSGYIDYYNFHFYHQGQDPNVDLTGKPSLPSVMNAIHSVAVTFNHGQKPIWLTEFGYTTNCDPSTCNYVTPQQQANYEQEVLDDGRTSGGVLDHAFIYSMEDNSDPFGIVQNRVFLPAYNMVKAYSAQYPTWPQL